MKTVYETSNKSEMCHLFEGKFQRTIKRDTVSKFIKRFEDTGSTTDDLPRPRRPVAACSPENRDIIRCAFSLSPIKSTRRATMELNISRTSIRRLLSQLELKAYRPHLGTPCHRMTQTVELSSAKPSLTNAQKIVSNKMVMSTDVTPFIGLQKIPHKEIERDVNAPGVTVWAAIYCDASIGGHFSFLAMSQVSHTPQF